MMKYLDKYWKRLSPAVRLSTAYVAIVMGVSIGFSVVLYRVSSAELTRQAHRPTLLLPRYDQYPDSYTSRQTQLEEGMRRLRANLIVLNLATLGVGAAVSYYLARRTLAPIEAALVAQTRFAADASHELRTPLTAMQTEIEVALRDKNLTTQEARQQLSSNLEEVGKLRGLADSLLKLASADSENISYKPVPLKDIVKLATERLNLAAKSKEITIVPQVDGRVFGDRGSLTELLVVLLDNAIKYSDPKTNIEVSSVLHNGRMVIKVKDEGKGIKASDLPHIFNRFYRADLSRSKEQISGYGLGLSIAKQIVDSHHGTIAAESNLAQGSTFTVVLPAA